MLLLPLIALPLVAAYSAEITWFADSYYTVGHMACMDGGYVPQDPYLFAAMSVYFLSDQSSIINSGQCGRCIRLTGDRGSVVVTVMDVMLNDAKSPYDLDLSLPAFQAVTAYDGLSRADWDFVDCQTGLADGQVAPPSPSPEPVPTTQDAPAAAPVATTAVVPVPAPNPLPTIDTSAASVPKPTIDSKVVVTVPNAPVFVPVSKTQTTSDATAHVISRSLFVSTLLAMSLVL
ncbi:hypothetical protein HDU79_003662 [Rhizoclosmatium sp. JEL0117]|nr:hypothetical protein HDU79_003662 [Rhizoclosmatium sp. JEL0117]